MTRALIGTPWGTPLPKKTPANDAERHEMFIEHIRQVADIKMPWLFPLLDECVANIYAYPGLFVFSLASTQDRLYEVPELGRLIAALPWVEEDAQIQ